MFSAALIIFLVSQSLALVSAKKEYTIQVYQGFDCTGTSTDVNVPVGGCYSYDSYSYELPGSPDETELLVKRYNTSKCESKDATIEEITIKRDSCETIIPDIGVFKIVGASSTMIPSTLITVTAAAAASYLCL